MQVTTTARLPVLVAVLICMCMIAIEATIVTTAMPRIAGQLGDFQLYSWIFSAYLLAQTSTTMLFGKLADVYGRKPILFVGLAVFFVASFLAGHAQSMLELAVIRAFQGLGAGSIHPVAITVVGDLYRGPERGRIQGYFLGVWVVSSLLGPPFGSLIVQYASWEWVFWLNLPFCVIAASIFAIFLKEKVDRAERSFNKAGSLFMIAIAAAFAFALACFSGGGILLSTVAVVVFLVLLASFLRQQSRIRDGILSLDLWRRKPIFLANCATLLSSMTIAGLSAYLPLYLQVVMRESPSIAGLTLSMMLLSWQVAAMATSTAFNLFGFRLLFVAGGVILPLGTAMRLLLGPDTAVAIPAVAALVMGLGIGFINMAALLMMHEILDWGDRASATAANLFSRNLGSAMGASGFGLVLNALFAPGGRTSAESGGMDHLLGAADIATPAGRMLIHAFDHAAFWMFLAMFGVAAVTALSCILLPQIRPAPGKS